MFHPSWLVKENLLQITEECCDEENQQIIARQSGATFMGHLHEEQPDPSLPSREGAINNLNCRENQVKATASWEEGSAEQPVLAGRKQGGSGVLEHISQSHFFSHMVFYYFHLLVKRKRS